jgi:hypothetical protein
MYNSNISGNLSHKFYGDENYFKESHLQLQPFRLISILSMLRFHAEKFLGIKHLVDQVASYAHYREDVKLEEDIHIKLKEDADLLISMLSDLELKASAKFAQLYRDRLNYTDIIDDSISHLFWSLYISIKNEFENQIFLMIPSKKAIFYDSGIQFFNQEVKDRFSDLIYDIDEACKCYAFGRSTACIFHLMRIMEKAVQQLGNTFGVPLVDEKNWQTILTKTRNAVENKYPNERDRNRIQYENTIAQLESVKIAWRNPTMHPKSTYTEDEAENLLRVVKMFMNDLAKIV